MKIPRTKYLVVQGLTLDPTRQFIETTENAAIVTETTDILTAMTYLQNGEAAIIPVIPPDE